MAFENRVIPSGQTQTVPFEAVSISGLASWDGNRLKITGFNVAELQQLKELDGLFINGELGIIAGLPASLSASVISVMLVPGRKFTASFTDEPIQWTKGLKWSDYPLEWHIYGDDFLVAGNAYNAAIGFATPILPFVVEAINDTYIGAGNIINGSAITVANFANTDLTFTGNRTHELDGNSLVIREPGIHSFQLGADVPISMFPLPGLKFSGLTGSNVSDQIMTFNGGIKGIPGWADAYMPARALFQGDPFGSGGIQMADTVVLFDFGGGNFVGEFSQDYLDTNLGVDVSKRFVNGDYALVEAGNENDPKWLLTKGGNIEHVGQYSNKPFVYNGIGNTTIPDGVSTFIYDPLVQQTSATITLPANPRDGQCLNILGGGTITLGNVIVNLTVGLNSKNVVGSLPGSLNAGKAITLQFRADNNSWYVATL